MTKKKIAFVVAIPGSAEAFLTNHFEVLTQVYDVTLIANFPKDYDASCFKGVKINYINAPIKREISVKNDLNALWKLYKILILYIPSHLKLDCSQLGLRG